MADITFDIKGKGTFTGTGGSQTLATFSIGANTNPILLVAVWSTGGTPPGVPSWNGSAMTNIVAGTTGGTKFVVYKHISPSTGSNSLTATNTNSAGFGFFYSVYYNLSTTFTDGTSDSGTGTTDPVNLDVTPASDSDLVVFYGFTQGGTGSALSGTGAVNNAQTSNAAGNAAPNISGLVADSGVLSPVSSVRGTLTTSSAESREIYAVVLKASAQKASLSDSVLRGASRNVTVARTAALLRTLSDSILVGASRVVTVARAFGAIRMASVSVMNAASRFVSVSFVGALWLNTAKHTSTLATTSKSSSSWTTGAKDSSNFTNATKT